MMPTKLQNLVVYIKENRWKSGLIAGGSLLFILSPFVQCPIIFVRAYMLRQSIKSGDMMLGFSKIGEAFSLRNEAIGKSCQNFTWMIPNKESKEAMDHALKPIQFPSW